jgi:hypothetical protein
MEELKPILSAIHTLCSAHGETDAVALAREVGLPRDRVCDLLEQIDELGLANMEEFGFSCSVEYTVTGLTEEGRRQLNS